MIFNLNTVQNYAIFATAPLESNLKQFISTINNCKIENGIL